MSQTFWSLVPALVAIALALITKEVYMSLLIGILSGSLLFTNFNVVGAVETTFGVMGEKIGGNANIIMFLILLGILVVLITKSGASSAYSNWTSKTIKSRRGALLATSAFGAFIFVDDYFNCLTVGTVMRPITDKNHITRSKLAYIIDATAAPVCIIAPVSSWAAAVASSLPANSGIDGFSLFLQTIPYNLYAILTLVMIVVIMSLDFDFGPMKKHEIKYKGRSDAIVETVKMDEVLGKGAGGVLDLVLPILVLIVLCITAMLYTGGLFEGTSLVDAFANCNASLSLVIGSFFTIIFTMILYLSRKIITYTDFTESFVDGFKSMTPAILILVLAWTLSGICGEEYLNAGGYVSTLVNGNAMAHVVLPAVFFLVALGLAFSTGTSWGTFGILIPIIVAIFTAGEAQLLAITVSAVLAGAVCGDHISPISDTTILSSAGAGCKHIDHVTTQMPYALIVAFCSFVGFIVAGFTQNALFSFLTGFVLLMGILLFFYKREKAKNV